ncbi:hypothetical protein D9M71_795730 [compost metagenome]
MAAVALGPGHAKPAAFAKLATEGAVGTVPVLGSLGSGKVFEGLGEKAADLDAQGFGLGVQVTGSNIECLHNNVLM